MKTSTLKEELNTLDDKRRNQAKQHSIQTALMITIIATMSGYKGYRALGDFTKRYKKELIQYLEVEKQKLPSFATIRRILINIEHKKFEDIFTRWMKRYMIKTNSKWISIDGKAIKGTKQKEEDKKLAHLVSFFTSDSKEILIARKTASKSNEIPLVQEMMLSFPLKDMIITLDALHTQTKTCEAIIKSGNDYVIQVKNNQKKL